MTPPHAALRAEPTLDLDALNAEFRGLRAAERVARALELLPGQHVLSSSFGAQAAVSLHLVTSAAPRIPVILIDTGYLFPETYRFVDGLRQRFDLNLKVYRSGLSPAWLEARHGRLWEQGREGIERYNQLHKVEPMERALRELRAGTWFAVRFRTGRLQCHGGGPQRGWQERSGRLQRPRQQRRLDPVRARRREIRA